MTCNICGAHEATIHLTEIVNNEMMEIHLCENCAREKGTDFKTHFNINDLLAGLSLEAADKTSKTGEKRPVGRCPDCGLSYDEFAKSGRLGCAGCYEAFARMLLPLIKRIQKNVHHVGKKPNKMGKALRVTHDLRVLQDRLRKSIQTESFEEAARLRDEIQQIEEKMKKSRKSKNG